MKRRNSLYLIVLTLWIVTAAICGCTPSNSEVDIKNEMKKWTWNDKKIFSDTSSVLEQTHSKELLFRTWTTGDDETSAPVVTFRPDSVFIHNEAQYTYSLNFDSLRIFSSYEFPGDGITRGIITRLTSDSLVIHWSTDDIDLYVPFESCCD